MAVKRKVKIVCIGQSLINNISTTDRWYGRAALNLKELILLFMGKAMTVSVYENYQNGCISYEPRNYSMLSNKYENGSRPSSAILCVR